MRRGLIPQLYSSSLILDRCKDESDNATLLCRKINELLHIQCPATEVVWLCLFLKECRHYRQRIDTSPDCGVILIAHGATTATSRAQYVNRVLERDLFYAIDMPFEQSVHDTGNPDPDDSGPVLAAADTDGGYRIAGPFWQHHQQAVPD